MQTATIINHGMITGNGITGDGDAGVTRVSGGNLVLDGANRLAAASARDLSGGNLKITNAGGPNGQTFASLTLEDSPRCCLQPNSPHSR